MIIFGIILMGLMVFLLLWIFVIFISSRIGGWSRLAKKFRTGKNFDGDRFVLQSGRFGLLHYNSMLTVTVGVRGLGISVFPLFRPFHPPLLIPWESIRNIQLSRLVFLEYLKMEIYYPEKIAVIFLSKKPLESPMWQAQRPY